MVNKSTNINNDISHQIIEHRKEPNHMTYVASVHVLFILWEKIAIVLFKPKRQIPKHREVNLTSNWHAMLSGELDHTYHLECCLGETDKDLPQFQSYHHLQMLHIYLSGFLKV
jgi:hypothetical protein